MVYIMGILFPFIMDLIGADEMGGIVQKAGYIIVIHILALVSFEDLHQHPTLNTLVLYTMLVQETHRTLAQLCPVPLMEGVGTTIITPISRFARKPIGRIRETVKQSLIQGLVLLRAEIILITLAPGIPGAVAIGGTILTRRQMPIQTACMVWMNAAAM